MGLGSGPSMLARAQPQVLVLTAEMEVGNESGIAVVRLE
jgi:hypothetical protein